MIFDRKFFFLGRENGPGNLGRKINNPGCPTTLIRSVLAVRDGHSFECPINSTKAQNNAGLIL